jgi:hypothetical protein
MKRKRGLKPPQGGPRGSAPASVRRNLCMPTNYDTDFYTWTQEQATLLREGAFPALALPHLAEES